MPATSYKAHGLICEAATIFEFLANVFIFECVRGVSQTTPAVNHQNLSLTMTQ